MNLLLKLFLTLIFFLGSIFVVYSYESFELISPNYFGDQKNVFESINYLENEILSFEVCGSSKSNNFKAELICGQQALELDLFEKIKSEDKNCYYSNYLLENLSCNEFNLEITYQDQNLFKKIDRNFKLQKESLLLNHILNQNFESLSPLDLSYYLVTLNSAGFNGVESEKVYEKLRNLRNNENKCWPKDNCDLELTSEILKNLKMANYELNSRLLADGKIYLEQNLIKNHQIDFNSDSTSLPVKEFYIYIDHEFSQNEEVRCELIVDNGEENRNYIFDSSSRYNDLLIKRSAKEKVEFECDSDLDNIELFIFDREIYAQSQSNRDSLSYTISNSVLQSYDEFNYRLFLEKEFSQNEEVSCDIEIDQNSNSRDFDENSQKSDFLFTSTIEENFSLDCEERFERIYLNIFAGNVFEERFENQRKFEYVISNTRDDTFKFNLFLDYNFQNNEILSCGLKIDSGNSRNYNFQKDSNLEILNLFLSDTFNLECNRNLGEVRLEVFDKFNRVQVDEIIYDTDKKSFKIPSDFGEYSCIGRSGICNFYTSLNAISIYGNTIEDFSKIESYVGSFLSRNNNLISVNYNEPIGDSGKFLFFKKNDNVKDFLRFRQNNEGSWGSGSINNKLEMSSFALIGLSKHEPNSEYIKDGKNWIYFNEPSFGWGNTKRNTLAYLAIKEQLKPYLKINEINYIDKKSTIFLKNPTIYNILNLEVSFSEEIDSNLEYVRNLGNLNSEEELNFTVKLNPDFKGTTYGRIQVTGIGLNNKRVSLLDLPIQIRGPIPFNILPKNYSFTNDLKNVILEYKSEFSFTDLSCSFENPFSGKVEQVSLSSNNDKIFIENNELLQGEYSILFNCKLDDNEFSIGETFNTSLTSKSFNINDIENYIITSLDDFSILLNSEVPNRQIVSFEITGPIANHVKAVEEQKIIAGNDNRSLFFTIENPVLFEALGNTSEGQLTIYSDTGYYKTINLSVAFQVEEESEGFSWWLVIAFVALMFILLVLYRLIQLRREENLQAEEFSDHDEEFYFEDEDFK